jgi:hypothetical protein
MRSRRMSLSAIVPVTERFVSFAAEPHRRYQRAHHLHLAAAACLSAQLHSSGAVLLP